MSSFNKGIMISAQTPVIKFAFRRDWKPLDEALVLGPAFQAPQFDNPLEALNSISKTGGLIICCLADKSDLLQIATLLKMSKKVSREAIFKIAVVNFSNNKLIETAVNKLGVQDVIDPNVSAKSLRFKIDLWMKSIKSQNKNVENSASNIKAAENAKAHQDKKADEKNYVILPAMDCVDDMWLIHKDFECKKILGRWLIRVLGPSPYVGLWAEVPNKNGVWKFEFREGHSADYIAGSGHWFYRGEQKPDFNWKENIWYMAGESLDLFYYDSQVLSRLQLKDKVLSICANSHSARAKEKAIYESFDKDLVFKKDVARLSKMEGSGKTEILDQSELSRLEKEIQAARDASSISGNLKGKISAEEKAEAVAKSAEGHKEKNKTKSAAEKTLDEKEQPVSHLKNLQGKTKTDALEEKNLSGKVKAEGNEAKASKERSLEENIAEAAKAFNKHSPHSSKDSAQTNREAYQEDSLKDLQGKTATDHLKQSNLSKKDPQQTRQDAPVSEDKRTQYKADEFNDLHGKNKTDHLGGKNLSGKNNSNGDISSDPLTLNLSQAVAKEARQKENGSKYQEASASDLSGKSNTDHLKHKNLAGKQKGEGDVGGDPLALLLKPEDKKPDHLDGKSSTDKINNLGQKGPSGGDIAEGSLLDYENKKHTHETMLKGRMLAEQFAAAEARKNQYQDKDGAELGGKSSTDQIKKHYSSAKEQAEAEEKEASERQAAALSGKTGKAADRFAGHLQSRTGKVQNVSKSGVKEAEESKLSFEEGFEHEGKVLPFEAEALKLKAKAEETKRVEELTRDLNDESDAELNRASQTATVTTFMIHKNQSKPCQMDDYFEENVIFRMPGTDIKLQDKVVLDMTFDYMGKKSQMKLEGTISSNEITEETSYVTVSLRAKEVDEFERFMKLYKSRQQNVDVFFKRVKGF